MKPDGASAKRLSTGRGNAPSIGERIRQLGVRTRRQAPPVLIDGLPVALTAEEDDEELVPGTTQASVT